MLWQVHEPHIAKSDFPQFPDEAALSSSSLSWSDAATDGFCNANKNM